MKRFMLILLSCTALLLSGSFLFYTVGIYIPSGSDEITGLPFRTEGKLLKHQRENGEYVPFTIRGVEVSSSMPGHYATEFHAEKEDYLRWFEEIARMGANTVKALRIMDDDFYNALYEYNQEGGPPLYLLQGFSVEDKAGNGSGSAFDEDFMGALKMSGRTAVDIIHGRKKTFLGGVGGGSGTYFRNISQWVIGFVVGSDWNKDMIAFTDHSPVHTGEYKGKYFSAGEEATPFEAMLAQVMDDIISYESRKYNSQHLIGILNSPEYDFIKYDENYRLQLKKYSYLDPEHIVAEEGAQAGCFAPYRLLDYCDDFSAYLSEEFKQENESLLLDLEKDSCYGGYLQFLARYHTMPVVVSEYKISSARGIVSVQQRPCTEKEQGEKLLEVYKDAVRFGWSGVCISSWQDTWEQKSWNTSFASNLRQRSLWHDLQTDSQSYGLMTYEPGEKKEICIIDGNPKEWEDSQKVISTEGQTLFACYDWKGLYLLLQGEHVNPETPWYIPLDLSEDVGSNSCSDPRLNFSRRAEFLLSIDGTQNSRLLVQDRYQAARENFLFEIEGQNPFARYPDKDSTVFEVVQMAVNKNILVENYILPETMVKRDLKQLGTWNTGWLRHGNGDPDAEDFCSLADFCFGENCVEIRLPWLLLNVADPVTMKVHKDYYENYGVEYDNLREIWAGIGEEEADKATVQMNSFSVKGTGRKPEYHERLKKSYDVIQRAWEEEQENAFY